MLRASQIRGSRKDVDSLVLLKAEEMAIPRYDRGSTGHNSALYKLVIVGIICDDAKVAHDLNAF